MVGAADDQDAVVALQPVDFIEEVAAHGVGDDAVEIFEDEEARRGFAGFGEDLSEGGFGPGIGGEGADVEGWDWGGAVVEGVHHGFDRQGFAVAGGTVEDYSSFPGGLEVSRISLAS